MWKDFVDTLDVIAPRAMIIALACMTFAEFFPQLGSYDVDVTHDGQVDEKNRIQIAKERKTGEFHIYILNQDADKACVLAVGLSLKTLKNPLRIPLPSKKATHPGKDTL